MSEKKTQKNIKPNVLGEMIIPLFGILFTSYYFFTIIDSPWTAQVNAFIVGSILFLICALFFVRKFQAVRVHRAVCMLKYDQFLPAMRTRQTGFIILTIGYLLFVELLGYTLATIIFFFSSMSLLDGGRKMATKFTLSIIMAGVGYVVFILLFETRLPEGFIEKILQEGLK